MLILIRHILPSFENGKKLHELGTIFQETDRKLKRWWKVKTFTVLGFCPIFTPIELIRKKTGTLYSEAAPKKRQSRTQLQITDQIQPLLLEHTALRHAQRHVQVPRGPARHFRFLLLHFRHPEQAWPQLKPQKLAVQHARRDVQPKRHLVDLSPDAVTLDAFESNEQLLAVAVGAVAPGHNVARPDGFLPGALAIGAGQGSVAHFGARSEAFVAGGGNFEADMAGGAEGRLLEGELNDVFAAEVLALDGGGVVLVGVLFTARV